MPTLNIFSIFSEKNIIYKSFLSSHECGAKILVYQIKHVYKNHYMLFSAIHIVKKMGEVAA